MSIFRELNLIPLDFQGDYEIRLVYHIWVEESGLTFGIGAQCSRSNAYGHALIGKPDYDGNRTISLLELEAMGLNMKGNRI